MPGSTWIRDVAVLGACERTDIELVDPQGGPPASVDIDGSGWVCLPGFHDADQNWPIADLGVREGDRYRALTGGATHVTTAVPWDRIVGSPATFAASLDRLRFPQLFPVLTVPREQSARFAPWFSARRDELDATWPRICRMFSSDPHIDANLDAIRDAGWRAAVFCSDDDGFNHVFGRGDGALHLRHATSGEQVARARARPSTTVQTSPHFLLPLPEGRAEHLHVRPPVPGGAARQTLLDAFDDIDVLCTDHGGPVIGKEEPGLDVASLLLPAVLALAGGVEGLDAVLPKVTTGPAATFDVGHRLVASRIIVDPSASRVVGLEPYQEARRAPYVGIELPGRVVAVVQDGAGFLL